MISRLLIGLVAMSLGLSFAGDAEAQRKRAYSAESESTSPISRLQFAEPSELLQGRRYLKVGKPHKALDAYRTLLETEHNPRFRSSALNGSCAAYIALGQYTNALNSCDEALDLRPRKWRTHNNRGTALFHLGRLRDAIKAYKRAQKLAPKSRTLRTNLALAEKRLNTLTGGSVNDGGQELQVMN